MKKKKTVKLVVLSLLLIIFLLFVGHQAIKFSNKVQQWKEHREYFEKKDNEKEIEEWMTFRFLTVHYNISEEYLMNVTGKNDFNFYDKKETLREFCQEHHKNCSKIVRELNTYINSTN